MIFGLKILLIEFFKRFLALKDFKFVNEICIWRNWDAFISVPAKVTVKLFTALSIFGWTEEFQIFSNFHLDNGKFPALRAFVAAKLK